MGERGGIIRLMDSVAPPNLIHLFLGSSCSKPQDTEGGLGGGAAN